MSGRREIRDVPEVLFRVTTRDMVREHKASPNTAKATFANLVKKGLLVRHGAGRSIWYGLS
jgi:predicted HTH transcriptional regulator